MIGEKGAHHILRGTDAPAEAGDVAVRMPRQP
jgi:hypothetical protein